MRCAKPGKAGDRFGDDAGVFRKRLGRGVGERRVLMIVRARQMRGGGQIHHLGRRAGLARRRARRRRRRRRGPSTLPTETGTAGGPPFEAWRVKIDAGMRIVHADHDLAGLRSLFQQARLDGGVVLQRAVAVEMIGRDVGEHRHVGHETGRELDLIGRDFQHIDRLGARRIEFQHGLADIAADLHVEAAGGQDVPDQARWWWTCRWCR